METKRLIFLFFFLAIALWLSTPRLLLFYDAPEYVKIISEHSFFDSLSQGHPPIHPAFTAFLWLTTHMIKVLPVTWDHTGNLTAFLWGISGVYIFFQLAKKLFNSPDSRLLATGIFALFPAVWMVNTNLMVESLLLPTFILSTIFFLNYLKKPSLRNRFLYLISIIFLLTAHAETLLWLPLQPLSAAILEQGRPVNRWRRWLTASLSAIPFVAALYTVLILKGGNELIPYLRDTYPALPQPHTGLSLLNFARMLRNTVFSFNSGFGNLSLVILLIALFRLYREKRVWEPMIVFLLFFLNGFHWTGDFMTRRLIFMAPFLAIIFTKQFGKKAMILTLYLLPITLANALLYSPGNPYYYQKLNRLYSALPQDQILIQTHYLAPFTKYCGEIVYLGVNHWDQAVNSRLQMGKRVFVDSQALIAPYGLVVGENYHVTAPGKPKNLPIESVINRYDFVPVMKHQNGDQITLYEVKPSTATPHQPPNLSNNLVPRRRLDFGDLIYQLRTVFRPAAEEESFFRSKINLESDYFF